MKKLQAFAAGMAASWVLLTLAVVDTVIYAVISVAVNGGHPWPHEAALLFGVVPAVIFLLLTAVALIFFRKVPMLKLRQFYAGAVLGGAVYAGIAVYLVRAVSGMS